MEPIQLNSGVSFEKLFPGITQKQLEKVKKLAENGFTEAELQELLKEGIDTSLLTRNASTVSKPTVNSAVEKLKQKYCADLPKVKGDVYSATNPELQAFSQALKDGLIADLTAQGFSKTEIVDIISKAFPTIGIKNVGDDGSYSLPKGHGAEAKQIYDQFLTNMALSTNFNGNSELSEAQDRLNAINRQIRSNNTELANLEYEIISLQLSIEDKINDAIDKSKEIADEQKQKSKEIIKKRLDEYVNSKGEMSYAAFQNNVSADLDILAGETNSQLSQAFSKIISAMGDMTTMNEDLFRMNTLIRSNKELAKEADDVKETIKAIQEEMLNQENAGDKDCKRCDPIGFRDAAGIRYDFFVDRDNNGDITNENEFLGADSGFAEMINNDLNGDKKVDAQELDRNNVKVIVTKPDGTQEIKKASEVFKEGDSIDLNSYTAQNKDMGGGNSLLGRFDVNIGGKTLNSGYQTMDTLDWLDENYEFTDELEGKGRHQGAGTLDNVEALDFSRTYKNLKRDRSHLKSDITTSKGTFRRNESRGNSSMNSASQTARMKGQIINSQFEEEKKISQEEQKLEEQCLEFEEFDENP
ncbi:hypothetical protein IKQ26_01855 [bacterium]|nr:hypothetical protein [bacterium]